MSQATISKIDRLTNQINALDQLIAFGKAGPGTKRNRLKLIQMRFNLKQDLRSEAAVVGTHSKILLTA
jgi:hypothetical protein